ncbi:ABC transporter ATP-binding protein [Flavihumibacter sp. RY-1]|uniref:ABC transporter ATP-binding protein n=1 Tax=Flavihumibacter fluminis TaxID=2909236 RepID=A0ABS9BG62_9BACT|nr:ABC transporter ATP-binding protein [Flavihumibacter fluminis]MCF1713651.1 ABC transporter ATP-binding protein [Flavihumibacter fluminis]
MHKAILEVQEISVRIGDRMVLYPISLELRPGQKLAVAGETGSGKSTLLKAIAGLQNLKSGAVYLQGERVEEAWEKLIPGHRKIAYLSQHFELRNNYRVQEILNYAEKVTEQEAAEIYRLCQIDHLLNRKTDQLSGGERQRIAMARLLVGAPILFLLDEPFSNLDALHKQTMKQVMLDLGKAMQINWVLVSHDPGDWLSWADELLILREGRQLQKGNPASLFYAPEDEYTAGLLGTYSVLNASEWEQLSGERLEFPKIIRPAQLQLSTVNTAPLKGYVKETEFVGYGYLLTVELESGNRIKLFHQDACQPDSPVGVQLR